MITQDKRVHYPNRQYTPSTNTPICISPEKRSAPILPLKPILNPRHLRAENFEFIQTHKKLVSSILRLVQKDEKTLTEEPVSLSNRNGQLYRMG